MYSDFFLKFADQLNAAVVKTPMVNGLSKFMGNPDCIHSVDDQALIHYAKKCLTGVMKMEIFVCNAIINTVGKVPNRGVMEASLDVLHKGAHLFNKLREEPREHRIRRYANEFLLRYPKTSTQKKRSLEDLPNEMLVRIVEALEPEAAIALAQTSRRLHIIIDVFLKSWQGRRLLLRMRQVAQQKQKVFFDLGHVFDQDYVTAITDVIGGNFQQINARFIELGIEPILPADLNNVFRLYKKASCFYTHNGNDRFLRRQQITARIDLVLDITPRILSALSHISVFTSISLPIIIGPLIGALELVSIVNPGATKAAMDLSFSMIKPTLICILVTVFIILTTEKENPLGEKVVRFLKWCCDVQDDINIEYLQTILEGHHALK